MNAAELIAKLQTLPGHTKVVQPYTVDGWDEGYEEVTSVSLAKTVSFVDYHAHRRSLGKRVDGGDYGREDSQDAMGAGQILNVVIIE